MGRHIRNTECNGHMCGCRNSDSERDRYLSKVTQKVNERGETRIISVLGVVLGQRDPVDLVVLSAALSSFLLPSEQWGAGRGSWPP